MTTGMIIGIVAASLCLTIVALLFVLIGIIKEYFYITRNKNYLEVQNEFCEKAYDVVYKDQIVTFSSSGYKISGDDLETSKRNFVKLVINLMGPQLYNYLKGFYGGEGALINALIIWFTNKLDNDQLLEIAEQELNPDGAEVPSVHNMPEDIDFSVQ